MLMGVTGYGLPGLSVTLSRGWPLPTVENFEKPRCLAGVKWMLRSVKSLGVVVEVGGG